MLMDRSHLRALLDEVATGALTPEAAQARLLQYLSQSAFEDLGFARVDHQRGLRQGFPEVVFGQGKTPGQVAVISERIVAAGSNLLVTRTTAEAYSAVRERVPAASFHELARTITLRIADHPLGRGTIVVAAAGTADIPVAEEAAISADLMGNTVERVYDVGVA